jgi:feruloyl esterase
MRKFSGIAGFLVCVGLSLPAAAATCGSLTALKLSDTVITAAQDILPGKFVPPEGRPSDLQLAAYRDLPAFCRVQGVIKPSDDSHIEFEVWLPASKWNGKYLGVGNGGSGGFIPYASAAVSNAPSMVDALRDGFASASTDTGHRGTQDDFSFGRGHPEKRIDYDYRAIHEMTVKARAVIRAFYGTAAKYAYFIGCSNGGRQALIEAQRYPADYDGLLACAPTASRTATAMSWAWVAQALAVDPGNQIAPNKIPAVQAAVIAACDALDGLKDGIIDDPTKCHFDPAVLLCKDGESDGCLTQPQISVFEKLYSGARNSRGEQITPGFPPGAETDPGGSLLCPDCMSSAAHRASTFFEGMMESRFSVQSFNFDTDARDLEASEGAKLANATNPNLKALKDRGGKLVIVHGWSDGTDSPVATVNYYQSIVSTMGVRDVSEFLRLYMVPGMQHGGGGPGPNRFRETMTAALEAWVEKGTAPGPVVATKYKTDGNPSSGIARTRPLCAYPQTAMYKGNGSIEDAANFSCR